MSQKYAYGMGRVDGVDCPAVAVGWDPQKDVSSVIAESYDQQLIESEECGTVDESTAKEAWITALNNLKTTNKETDMDLDEAIGVGKDVAYGLGWL